MKLVKHTELIQVIKGALTPEYCNELVRFSENIGYEDADIKTEGGMVMNKDVRNNSRVIYDSPEMAEKLWGIIKKYVPEEFQGRKAIGLNERFRFYRYDVGHEFDWHIDGCYRRSNGESSEFTLIFYLNDNFEGGSTDFEEVEIYPSTGDALMFWHPQSHCGAVVYEGRKYAVRTDIMFEAVK